MKRIILVYGFLAGTIIIGIITLLVAMWDPSSTHVAGMEWVGYVVMVLALSLVFFGVKRYRDRDLGGVIRFWDALKMGVGITLVASAVYVAGWESYLAVSQQDFMEDYAQAYIERLKSEGAGPGELEAAEQQMDSYREMYAHPVSRMGITFLEIFPVGLAVSLISAGVLRRRDFLPAGESPGSS